MAITSFQIQHVKNFLIALEKRSHTARELADITGLRRLTIYQYLKVFNKGPLNIVFIEGYRKLPGKKGKPEALWRYGFCRENALMPPKQSQKIKNEKAKTRYRTLKTKPGILIHSSENRL